MQLFALVTNIVKHPWVFSGKKYRKIRQKNATVKIVLPSVIPSEKTFLQEAGVS